MFFIWLKRFKLCQILLFFLSSTFGGRVYCIFVLKFQENVDKWLTDLGLHEYWIKFKGNAYDNPKALEDLKAMSSEDLEKLLRDEFEILKKGHIKKLRVAIQRLQYPSPSMFLLLYLFRLYTFWTTDLYKTGSRVRVPRKRFIYLTHTY